MTDRHADLVSALRAAVFDGEGEVPPTLRRAAGSGEGVPEPWTGYVEKVREQSYRIGDADVAALRSAGCTEEEIFEITVAAASGAALHRLDVGLRALERGS